MPLSLMKALKPITPRWWRIWRLSRLSGTRPPHRPKSTRAFCDAIASFSSKAAGVVVGGCALRGISSTVVTPPAAAPRVPASQPSQSARPGSLKCTWASTRPGKTTSPGASMTSPSSRTSVPIAETTPCLTAMSTDRRPVGRITVPPRMTRESPVTRFQSSCADAKLHSGSKLEAPSLKPLRNFGVCATFLGSCDSPDLFYDDLLRSLPKCELAELGQLFLTLCDCCKVIPRQLPHLAGKHRRPIGEEHLGFADAPGVEQQHPGRGVARVVLEVEAEALVAHRDPGRLAAPAAVNYLGAERQHFADDGNGLGRVLVFETRFEGQVSHADLEHAQH